MKAKSDKKLRTSNLSEKVKTGFRNAPHWQEAIFEGSRDAIFISDIHSDFIMVNQAACQLTAYSKKELLKMKIPDLHEPQDLKAYELFHDRIMDGEEVLTIAQILKKNGQKVDAEFNNSRIIIEDTYYMLTIARDITERKLADQKIRENEEKLNTIFNVMEEGMALNEFVFDEQGDIVDYRILEVNKSFERITSLSREQVVGRLATQIYGLTKEYVNTFWKKHIHDQYAIKTEFYYEYSKRWMSISTSIPVNNQFSTVFFDITERKREEEKLNMLSSVVEQSAEGMAIADLDANLTFVNQAWCQMHGYKNQGELVGKNLAISHNQEQLENEVKPFNEKVIKLGAYSGEVGHITREGKPFPTLMTTTLLKDKDGRPFAYIGIARDITEKKLTEVKLKESEEHLELFFAQSLDGFFFMMLDEPIEWNENVDKEKALDYVFEHQRITKANKAMLDQYGATEEQYLGLTPADAFAHDIKQGRQVWKDFFNKGQLHIDTHEKKFDGSDMIIEGDYICLYDAQKRITGHFGIQREVTEARHAIEALQKSRSELHQYFENDISADYVVSFEGEIFSCNKTFLKMFGFKEKSHTEEFNITNLYKNPDDRKEMLRKIKIDGKVENYEVDFIALNGKTINTIINAIGKHDEAGELTKIRGYIVDITKQKSAEKELREQQEFVKRIIDSSNDCIKVLDLDGNLLSMSEGGQKLLEIDDISVYLNKSWVDFWKGTDRAGAIEAINKAKKDGVGMFTGYSPTEKGTPKWWEIIITPIHNTNGNIESLLAISRDITERKQAENDLIVRNKLNLLKAKVWEAVSNKSTTEADLINLMLEEAGNVLNISRAAFLKFDKKKKSFVVKHQWYQPEAGSTKNIEIPAKYVMAYFDHDYVQLPLQLNKTIRIFASPILKLYNIKSWLAVAYGDKQSPSGLFSFTDCNTERIWTDIEIEVLIDLSKILESFTIQREAEVALNVSENKYRSLFRDHPQPMWIYDVDSLKFLEVNGAAIINYGYTKEEFLTMSLKDIRPEEDIPELLNNIKTYDELYQKDKSFRHKKKDGTIINVVISSHKIQFADNKNHRLVMAIDITDQYNAEKELLKLSRAVEQSPVSIIITDTRGNIEYGNPKVAEITGYTIDELMGKNPRIFNSGEKPKSEYQNLWATISSAKEWFGEFHNKKKNGELYWEYASISPIMNESGEITHYVAVKEDITERKKLEKTQEIMINISNMVLSTDNLETFFLNIYNELVKVIDTKNFFIGLYNEQNQMISTPFIIDSIDEDITDFAARETLTGYVIQTGKSQLINKKHFNELRENGEINLIGPPSEVWIGVPLFSEDKVIGVIVIQNYAGEKMLDEQDLKVLEFAAPQISLAIERKKTIEDLKATKEKAEENEEEYRKNHELLSLFIKNSPIYAFIKKVEENESRVIYASENYIDMTGIPAAEMIGKTMYDLFPKEFAEKITNDDYQVVKEGKILMLEEDLDDKNYITYKFPIVQGSKNLLAGYTIDITEHKQYEVNLNIAKEKAEESDRLKSAFLANMSHEIRTPMNGIMGFTELLLEPELTTEEKEKYIQIVHHSGQRMLNTVNDIVEISKIEAGIVSMNMKVVNIQERIHELISFFIPEATQKGLKLNLEKKVSETDIIIITDQNKFDSILTNLIKNAIKYTHSGEIMVGCKAKENVLEFYVQDTGIGIPAARQQAVFERFIQAEIENRDARQGTGLGLAITKAYVEMLGGEIRVDSKIGEGSTFLFTLPLDGQINENTDKKEETSGIEETKHIIKLNILIAEDDENSASYLKTILQSEGNSIIITKTGKETVETCRKNPDIDLVLMDIQMPGMNGYEATRQIREFNKDVIIIAQTAFALSGDREKALDAGCNDYISKPIKKNLLIDLMNKHFSLKF